MTKTELRPYELRDPGRVVADVRADHDLRDGDVLLAVVEDASTAQRLVHVVRSAAERVA